MRKEARLLFERAVDSLILAVEHFNRPWDRGRPESVLIQLDHSFEMLLKAIIRHKGARIREPRAKQTYGFDHCVRKCLTDERVKCLSREQALTLQMINGLRDAAQHYLLETSEEQLYLHTQAGVTLFGDLLKQVFGQNLGNHLPQRVLPVSTHPPQDLLAMVADEAGEIVKLLKPGGRRRMEARARLRPLAIMEASVSGEPSQPGDADLERTLRRLEAAQTIEDVFPGLTGLRFDAEGSGLTFNLRIMTKGDGVPIRLVKEGEPGAAVVAVKRVNELDYYSLGLHDLAGKCELSPPKVLVVVRHLGIQNDEEYFKVLKVGKQTFKRYSPKALDRLKKEIPGLDVTAIWAHSKNKGKSA